MNRNKGGLAWPGMKRLAEIARTTPRTVIRATKRLEAQGHLRVVRSHQEKRRGLNRYAPTLKRFVSGTVDSVSNPSPPSDQALSPSSDQALSHKPPNEPPMEPLSYTASVSTDAVSRKTQDKKSGEEERKVTPFVAKPNPINRCYELTGKHFPTIEPWSPKPSKMLPGPMCWTGSSRPYGRVGSCGIRCSATSKIMGRLDADCSRHAQQNRPPRFLGYPPTPRDQTPPRPHSPRPPAIDDRADCIRLPARCANVSARDGAQREALDAALGLSRGWPRHDSRPPTSIDPLILRLRVFARFFARFCEYFRLEKTFWEANGKN